MKIVLSLLLFFALCADMQPLHAGTYTVDNLPMVYLKDRTKHVVNPDGILSASIVERMDSMLYRLEAEKGVQSVVAVVERVEGGDCYEFAITLGNRYGVGSRQNTGLIILLSTQDRCYQILTGEGLEGTLPDAICRRIENRKMVPFLKTGDWDNAPTITVQLPDGGSVAVEIPVDGATSGTVAVLVKEDGTEEVIKTSVTTENGVAVTLTDGQRVKIVDNSKYFSDVPDSHWGAQAIDFASSRELLGGTGPSTFSPETAMTRGMIVTVLARMEGVDTSTGSAWYEAGQKWAIAEGISDGTNMEQGLTREQLALMLYRYANTPTVSGNLNGFADGDSVSSWATQAMVWAIQEGLISGVGNNTLNPQGQASRAQVATILMRFIEGGIQ